MKRSSGRPWYRTGGTRRSLTRSSTWRCRRSPSERQPLKPGRFTSPNLAPILLSKAVKATGGWTQVIGGGFSQSAVMAGNYWATTDYLGRTAEGEDVANRPGYDPSKPWIGEWGNAESMEQALKVRTALAMIPDRTLLNEAIFGGLGNPAFAYFGWSEDKPGFEESWKIPHDPKRAQELLAEAWLPERL